MFESKQKLISTIGLSVLTVFLFGSGLFLVFSPMPFFYLSLHGRKDERLIALLMSYALILASYTLAGMFSFPLPGTWLIEHQKISTLSMFLFGAMYFSFFVSIGIALGEYGKRKTSIIKWAGSSIIYPLSICILAIFAAQMFNWNLIAAIQDILTQLVTTTASISSKAGNIVQSELISQYKDSIVATILYILPSIVFVFAVSVIAINVIVSRRIMVTGHLLKHIHNTARFRLPDSLVWVLILSGILFFLDLYWLNLMWPKYVAANLFIATGSLYLWQGLAVLSYFLQQLSMPFLRVLTYVIIILFFQTVAGLIVLLGVCDVWVDFRRRTWAWRHGRK